MKPVHERNQECLPPKKRDLPQSCTNYEHAVTSSCSPSASSASAEAPDLLITAGPSDVGLRCSVASENCEERASVTLDQYGYLYNMAVPPAVVSMSSLPSAIIQHPAIPFPSIHCTPVSPTSVQYIGSPYALPCAVTPSFLSGSLMSSSHIPHYVPYGSLTGSASSNPSSGNTFKKAQSASLSTTSSPSQLQPHAGALPVEIAHGICYHHSSCVPSVYSVHEVPLTCSGSGTVPAVQNMRKRGNLVTVATSEELECNQGRMRNQILDLHNQLTDVGLHGAAGEHRTDGQLFSDYQTSRVEIAIPAHRDTPDTDLEVERVVSGLNCQSPVTLSHIVSEPQNELRNVSSPAVQRNPTEAAIERGQLDSLYLASSLQEVAHTHFHKPVAVSNGESEQGLVSASAKLVSDGEGDLVMKNSFVFATAPMQSVSVQPPNSSRMPSHFMKGAIIQLATGELKRVEDLQTQDFVQSAELSGGLKIDSSTVVDIQESQWPGLVTLHFVVGEQQSKVSLDVPPEHPFFVYGQGWSSCSPGQTTRVFALPCHRLQVGDVCISISLQSLNDNLASPAGCFLPSQPLSPKGRKSPCPRQQMLLTEKCKQIKNLSSQSSHIGSPDPETSGHYCWSSPGFQRYSLQVENMQPSPLRASFIPQEVKLSIEGRSNAGK
uniref:Ataxin-1-like n=1 Tax=Geotrypetes seraphini TaxID=260995 RepID=A0A6P8QQ44_GEOSA|nr:ataxin-1-like [Geotrypetes seraphini]XP_033797986.1 ataxin-1-like [Geotrypetes seraphini]